MSDPSLAKKIKRAATILVKAKVGNGHFVEAGVSWKLHLQTKNEKNKASGVLVRLPTMQASKCGPIHVPFIPPCSPVDAAQFMCP